MADREEKKNKRIALATSIGMHAVLFLAFLFAVAWRAPNPPLPEYGIELNFGLDTQGSGDIQPLTSSGSETPAEDESEEIKNDQPEEENKATAEEAKPESKQVEEQVTTQKESPVSVKEEKKEDKTVEKPKEKVSETKTEVKPKEAVNENAAKTTSEKTTTDNTKGNQVSQGDDTNKTGDKGDPKGSLDAKALYGKQGGGDGGAGLDLAGWNWDFIPKPNVPNNESGGRVVFEIKVDDNGDIISIKTIERSVSLEAEHICRKEIEKLTFTKTGSNVPSVSVGKITFIVRSN